MVASVILNCELLIGLTKMVEKSNSNKSKVNGEEERRDVVGLLVSKTRRRTVEVLEHLSTLHNPSIRTFLM